MFIVRVMGGGGRGNFLERGSYPSAYYGIYHLFSGSQLLIPYHNYRAAATSWAKKTKYKYGGYLETKLLEEYENF